MQLHRREAGAAHFVGRDAMPAQDSDVAAQRFGSGPADQCSWQGPRQWTCSKGGWQCRRRQGHGRSCRQTRYAGAGDPIVLVHGTAHLVDRLASTHAEPTRKFVVIQRTARTLKFPQNALGDGHARHAPMLPPRAPE